MLVDRVECGLWVGCERVLEAQEQEPLARDHLEPSLQMLLIPTRVQIAPSVHAPAVEMRVPDLVFALTAQPLLLCSHRLLEGFERFCASPAVVVVLRMRPVHRISQADDQLDFRKQLCDALRGPVVREIRGGGLSYQERAAMIAGELIALALVRKVG